MMETEDLWDSEPNGGLGMSLDGSLVFVDVISTMTDLRYLPDNDDVTSFTATVEAAADDHIILDGTYFYPEGGGQPADRGTLDWPTGSAAVVDVQKEHGAVRHYIADLEGELPTEGTTVEGQIDADRRQVLRRMHTAQHVLSKVVLDVFGAQTAGNQIHTDRSRIDFEPADFSEEDVAVIEERTNVALEQDLPVEKKQMARDKAEEQTPEGRGLLDLIPDHVDPLRMVRIGDLDLCPCGGTHVDRLSEVGRVRITNRTSKGADVDRIEFELVE